MYFYLLDRYLTLLSFFNKISKVIKRNTPYNKNSGLFLFFFQYVFLYVFSIFKYKNKQEKEQVKRITGKQAHFFSYKFYSKIREVCLKKFDNKDKYLLSNLNDISEALISEKNKLEASIGKKIILSPLHFFSDEFAVLATCYANDKKINCIANVGNSGWKENWGASEDDNFVKNLNMIDILQSSRREANINMVKVIKEFKLETSDLVVFLDALPEYTCTFSRYSKTSSTKLKKINIFGKTGLMHRGPFNLPQKLDAVLLPYQIVITPFGLKLIIHTPLENDLNNSIPKLIEKTLTGRFFIQWMFWHFTSFYYYNGATDEE